MGLVCLFGASDKEYKKNYRKITFSIPIIF